jgi:hypothetical protein
MKNILLILILLSITSANIHSADKKLQPNFILIFIDDMGWGDSIL